MRNIYDREIVETSQNGISLCLRPNYELLASTFSQIYN